MRNGLIISGIVVIVLLLSGCVSSNPPTVTPTVAPTSTPVQAIYINGLAEDQNGTPVPNARVALWQGDQLVQMPENTLYANDSGFFNFTNLQPAHYQVTADIQGHQGVVDQRFNASTSIMVVIPGYSVSHVTPTPGNATIKPGMPHFTVTRTGPTTIQVYMDSFGGAWSIKGFFVKDPVISTQEVIPVDKPLGEKEAITITDPNLTGTVHFVASSWVNGNYAVVVDTTV